MKTKDKITQPKNRDEEKTRASSDNICKLIAEKYPVELIEWLFGLKVNKVEVLKTELTREPIRADSVILLESGKQIFHVEFQTTGKSHLPLALRMLDYYVALKRKFLDKEIRQVLVVLTDNGENIPDNYKSKQCFFKYGVVKIWEEEPDELLKYVPLSSLAVLCGTKKQNEALLIKVANRINGIEDENERREQMNMAQMFAGLRFNPKMIYELLRGVDMLEESLVVQDWLKRGRKEGLKEGLEKGREKGREEGREQGREEGREEGLLQGERLLITRLLTKRFGRLSAKTKEQLENLSLKKIEKLSEALLDFKEKSELNVWLEKHSR